MMKAELPIQPFTNPVIQRIWGSPDAILFFFAGGAAEFAGIKVVDWLFFTGALPGAPIERFFETLRYAQHIFFADQAEAAAAVERVNRIHSNVERARDMAIPDWAYRDVLFILIDYGERAHTIVFGPMTEAEQLAHFDALLAIGQAMGIPGLPESYPAYQTQRHQQLLVDYAHSPLTDELYACYRRDLGAVRYWLLRLIQGSLLPAELRTIVGLTPNPLISALLRCYRYLPGGGNKVRWLHGLLLPRRYAQQLRGLARAYPAE